MTATAPSGIPSAEQFFRLRVVHPAQSLTQLLHVLVLSKLRQERPERCPRLIGVVVPPKYNAEELGAKIWAESVDDGLG